MAAETKSELPAAASTTEQTAVIEKQAGDQPAPFLGGTLDSTFFVGVAMAVFIAILLWKKVPGLIAGGLDRQIAAIRSRLDEASQLRAEAEALRDEYARKLASADNEVAGLMNQAETESQAISPRPARTLRRWSPAAPAWPRTRSPPPSAPLSMKSAPARLRPLPPPPSS
jgi:F-type H+-transporting ATPase subunit b